ILTSSLSWHAIFLFLIPVLLVSLFMGLSAIPEIPVKKTTTLDLVCLIGIALLFSGLLMFLSKIGTLFGWLSLLAAVIGF
ncbi:MFS transporter, partial [Enterococcus faecalis]